MKKLISSIIAIVFALNFSAYAEEKLTIEKQFVQEIKELFLVLIMKL